MLAGYEKLTDDFAALGARIVAASVDSLEKAEEVAKDVSFTVAHGVTRDIGDQIGAWWDDRRNFIQPSEFIITGRGRILSSTYSSSPVGRADPVEVLTLLKFITAQRKK